ncbi:Lrp/AsnC family transcriptional regulator [Thermococcus argininiproducens]|uniref:Lrp/AsnC family transcriptional regulator n=2 Tax=Thermococcus TaxID=2263 RepID=A0A9E7SCE0_9EURY|nr:Lrp/AsnC family transcriptional regulator [Thermococcus argininiproducens]USG99082.1 Lrp/AsnC family transcriptional regulator [Thermococcus argininiproducens]
MVENGVIKRFTIDVDHKQLGYELEVLLELKVKRGLPRPVALKLYKLPHVEDVWEITGDTDLIVRAYFKNVDELNDFLHMLGNNYPEIENVITHVVLGSYKNPEAWF